MEVFGIKLDKRIEPGESLFDVLDEVLQKNPVQEGDILAISSKVVAFSQNRIANEEEYEELLQQEIDSYYGDKSDKMKMTINKGILCPNGGIDRSNVPEGKIALWPMHPFQEASNIRKYLKLNFLIKDLGVMIIDSCLRPLRKGTMGITLGYTGFDGVNDVRGHKDLYDKELKYTQISVADNLACAADLLMGEANDLTPFVIIRNYNASFTEEDPALDSLSMPFEEDIFNNVLRKPN